MKDWYAGRLTDPLDRMDASELEQMREDAMESHRAVSWRRDEAERAGQGLRTMVLTGERKRLAAIANDIRRRLQ